jgi:hypothetical protein
VTIVTFLGLEEIDLASSRQRSRHERAGFNDFKDLDNLETLEVGIISYKEGKGKP